MLDYLNNQVSLQILIAFFCDLGLGDPYWFPHPVKGIGKIIEFCELRLRNLHISERAAGLILTISVVLSIYFVTQQFIRFAGFFGQIYQTCISIVIIYLTLSIHGLVKEAKKIIFLLKSDRIEEARNELRNIVGRDTANLDKTDIKRACIESLAENMVDGIISPMFFAFIGGAPLAIAYKAINTLDSMVGYKNSKYIRFGWASARVDDIANFIPARITFILIPVASFFCSVSPINSLRMGFRDGDKHPSPNSGIPEALFAGALKVQLGGPCSYRGVNSDKPFIGDSEMTLTVRKIEKAIQIVYVCTFLAVIFGSIILFLVY